ncbi:CotY/CotZ family spore coat protein [Ectobacillus antri]|uniref:CotY/CotZ family spore coat protein n=1 Tax=Ectobacillus antri TaxID=2486280 RepID=UPI000F59208A|nr:CotY/CotZ family spore coat protein [Ectobacillus antri]
MSCNDKHHYDTNCVCDVVNFINELQDVAQDTCPTGCDNPILGANCGGTSPLANTRPFVLYNKKGELFIPASCFRIAGISLPLPSPFLRVESVDECCAVLRVLVPTLDGLDDEIRAALTEQLGLGGGVDVNINFNFDAFDLIARLLICLYSDGISIPTSGGPMSTFFSLAPTNFCITVDLNCFCAIQCLRDTFVRGV